MKVNITKEWFASRSDEEKGLSVQAGGLHPSPVRHEWVRLEYGKVTHAIAGSNGNFPIEYTMLCGKKGARAYAHAMTPQCPKCRRLANGKVSHE